MKVSVPAAAPPVPPETGASIAAQAGGRGLGRDGAGAVHVDGRAVDEDGAGAGGGDDLGVDGAQDRAVRQHGDDGVAAAAAASAAEAAGATPSTATPATSKPVTAWPAAARLRAIGRAHVAESDEADVHGVSSRPVQGSQLVAPSGASIARPPRAARCPCRRASAGCGPCR